GVHGACLGAGIELPAFAARVVAADDTAIGLPEAGLGLVPGAGGTVSITRRAGRQRLLELLITGEPIEAATAHAWGLVDEVVARVQPACVVSEDWLEPSGKPNRRYPDEPRRPAVLLFTSGTSAAPKAAVLEHDHLLSYVFTTTEFASAGEHEANLLAAPPF